MEYVEKGRLILIVVLFPMLLAVPSQGSPFLVARVADLDYPKRVTPRQEFCVNVTFEYASRVLADAGILDEESARVLQSLTLISGFYGPGNVTFSFSLTAPESSRVWRLVVATRAWWAGSWFSDPNSGTRAFSVEVITGNQFWLNVTSGVRFEIDGVRYDPSTGEQSAILFDPGSHIIYAEETKVIGDGVRLVFDRWSDGIRSNPRALNLFQDVRLTAIYRTQYLLSVHSDHGEPVGGGWYDENSNASFAVLPEVRIPEAGIMRSNHVFVRWTGDGTGQRLMESVLMNGPKEIHAVWRGEIEMPTWISLNLLSLSMVLASIFFIIQGARIRPARVVRKLNLLAMRKQNATLIVLALLFVCLSITPIEAIGNISIIRLGATSWRHWEKPGSDTCIIWLGGGTEGSPLWINPYWLESYNTMQFVQDLARYYSVLTLEEGSSAVSQTALKRVIKAEYYPSTVIHDARKWVAAAGYQYVYLVGYSVGGIAVAREATVVDPETYSSPNGIILITVPLEPLVPYAGLVKANHLVFCGTEMTKSFIDFGKIYYDSTPAEGEYSGHWLHKELHVIDKVAHEVWTIAETGRYDSKAIEIVVNFIERSRSLQFEKQRAFLHNASTTSTESPTNAQVKIELAKINVPRVIRPNEVFTIPVTARGRVPNKTKAWIILHSFDASSILSVRDLSLLEDGYLNLTLFCRAPDRETQLQLRITSLCAENDLLAFPAGNHSATIAPLVTEKATLRIKTFLPGIPLKLDGASFTTGSDGILCVNVVPGHHLVEAPSLFYLTSEKRAIFETWSDGMQASTRAVRISEDYSLEAFYRTQCYVSTLTQFGKTAGEGWYDYNSAATITISPIVIQDRINERSVIHRFDGWSLGTQDRTASLSIAVTEPLKIEARWATITIEKEKNVIDLTGPLMASLFLVISVAFWRKRSSNR